MDELDFEKDDFSDIIVKDPRYNARAYTLLMDVFGYLSREGGGHASGAAILDEFKERALDLYGPMTYTVLTEWGLGETADIGEMMFNLVESKRLGQDEGDRYEDFANVYDFKETFLDPYQT